MAFAKKKKGEPEMTKAVKQRKMLAIMLAVATAAATAPAAAFGVSLAAGSSDPFALMYDSDAFAAEKAGAVIELAVKTGQLRFDVTGQESEPWGIRIEQPASELKARAAKAQLKEKAVEAFTSGDAGEIRALSLPSKVEDQVRRVFDDAGEERFIVKYKAGGSIDWGGDVKSVCHDGEMEFIELDEKVNPSEFASLLQIKNGASQIEYLMPDLKLVFLSEEASSGVELLEGAPLELELDNGPAPIGVVVGLIDTAVDTGHSALSGHMAGWWDAAGGNSSVYDPDLSAEAIHGTHLAGTIIEAAAGADVMVMAIKTFGSHGAYTSDVITALRLAEENGAKITNCSWGSTVYNPALKDAIQASGMLIVAAAGNSRMNLADGPIYPAAFNELPNVISVTSLNPDSGLSYFANYGPVDLSAVGREVLGAFPGGGQGVMSGTSVSAAKVSGAAAAVLSQNPSMDAAELKNLLVRTGDMLTHLALKVKDGRRLNTANALAGIEQHEAVDVVHEDDFDVNGWQPMPEETYV